MTEHRSIANRIAARFRSRFLQGYIRSKVQMDPLYEFVFTSLKDTSQPLLDIGCGVGIMSFYLRERGLNLPTLGVDTDGDKIARAQEAAHADQQVEFRVSDAREAVDGHRSVLLLDVLHYLTDDEQRSLLRRVARQVPPGGVVIVRDAIRDGSWRYRITAIQETFSRLIGWLKAERLNFPTRQTVLGAFDGFEQSSLPAWGATPFNNYLFVFKRPGSGMTNE